MKCQVRKLENRRYGYCETYCEIRKYILPNHQLPTQLFWQCFPRTQQTNVLSKSFPVPIVRDTADGRNVVMVL